MEREPEPKPSGGMGGMPPHKRVGTEMMDGSNKVHRVLEIIREMNPGELRELRSRIASELLS
ncbi:MAG: hypothetical protein HY427_01960 [Candidatus Levybacteria bacterium]|nr:hypothetical protein [Candidatus Levybacteria bacterium]